MGAVLIACAPAMPLRLPSADGPWAPSALQVEGDPAQLGDVSRCAACHPQAAEAWSTSAHAHASFDNPWYRSSVESLRDEVGRLESRHCGGCHDPALLATGAMADDVDPAAPLARVGVPCLACHGAVEATTDGNASLALDLTDLPFPAPDEREGPAVDAHRTRLQPAELASGAVCGACHRGFLDARTGNTVLVAGLDDLGSHAGSAFRGSRARRLDPSPRSPAGCTDCHFAGHRFPGGQTALATETGQLGAVREMLSRAVRVHVVAEVEGPDLIVDAVVHNHGTGHRFPGGLGDAQDTWLAVAVDDVGISAVHRLRAEVLDEAGTPERRHRPHRIGLVAWDHRVEPGDARVFRTVVAGGADASDVRVTLHHRPHPPELQTAACAATTLATLSGCGPVPDLVIARAEAKVGDAGSFETSYVHALGLLHQVSEHLGEARAPIARALSLAPDDRSRAAVLVLRGQLEGRLSRTESALGALEQAEALAGSHPAITRARAEALAVAWRWDEAAVAFTALAAQAPDDTATWRDLARARLSADDPRAALDAAVEGLRRAPRDPSLLRSQALAARTLDHPDADRAWDAWEAHRPRDDLADRRQACDRAVPGCADARRPVPVHQVAITRVPNPDGEAR